MVYQVLNSKVNKMQIEQYNSSPTICTMLYYRKNCCYCCYQEGFAVPDEALDGQDLLNDDEY